MTYLSCSLNFVFLTIFTHFAHVPSLPLATTNLFSVSMNPVFFFFKIPHVSEIIWYYLSLTFFTFPLGPSMLLQMVGLPSFSWLSNTPLYIHITALLIYLRVGSSPGGMLSSAPPTMPRGSLAACPLPPHSQVSSFIKNIRLTYEGCGMVVTNGTASSEPAADAVLLSYVSDH